MSEQLVVTVGFAQAAKAWAWENGIPPARHRHAMNREHLMGLDGVRIVFVYGWQNHAEAVHEARILERMGRATVERGRTWGRE